MKIEHVAIWTTQLEVLKAFYERYFGVQANAKYVNERKQFESYFLTFPAGEGRLEIMRVPTLQAHDESEPTRTVGYAHLALSVGSQAQVDALTARLQGDGFAVVDGPRWTGDGYYESVILDPDGNRVEITI